MHKQIFLNMTPQNQSACKKLCCFQCCAVPLWNYNNAADTTWFYKWAARKVMFKHKAWLILPWRWDTILRSLQQWQLVTSSKMNYLHSHLPVIGNVLTILSLKTISYFASFHAVALDHGESPPAPPWPMDSILWFMHNTHEET